MRIDHWTGTNVVSLEPRRMEQVFPAVSQVEAYWTALKGTAAMPLRSQVDPRGIEGALAQAFVLERLAPGVARFRLAGMHLSDLMGMEVRGMPLTALFLPEAREAAAEAAERAFTAPARATLQLTGERGIGRPPLDARLVLLPLLDDQGRVTRLFGALEARGEIGRQPRRFAVTDCRTTALPVVRVAAPEPAPGLAEAAAPYRAPSPRPALRLVKDE